MDLTDDETKVLRSLIDGGEYVFCFATIQSDTGLNRQRVREACRSLRDKKLARYERSTWDDDGVPAGSGYWATDDARRSFSARKGD